MRKFVIALAACLALASCNVTGKPGAAFAQASTTHTLVAVISRDGAEIDRLPFLRGGAPVRFEDKDACEAFILLPVYRMIRMQLDAYVAQEYGPDATADESCIPVE
jgi:hypothetical protein